MILFKTVLTKDFIRLKALIAIIYVLLEAYYYLFIEPNYPQLGFRCEFNLLKYILTKIVFLALLWVSYLIYERNKFLYSIYLLLLFFFYIPNAILFAMAGGTYAPFLCNVFFVSSFISSVYFKFKIPDLSLPEKYKGPGLIALAVLIVLPIIYTFRSSFNLNTLFLKEIYETRDVFSEKMTGLVNYLYHFSVKTILPIALVFFMIRKKPVFIVLFFMILIYLFVISGNKMVYFTAILLVYFYYVGKDYISKISIFFLITIVLFLIFPLIDLYVIRAEKPMFIGTFVNRFLFIPALLTQWYFEFFNHHPFYFAESSIFNQFVQSPYELPVGFLISKVYLNNPEVYANNGIVSDGFMNLGYAGVVLFSFVFSMLFAFFNSLNIHKGFYGLFFSYIYIILSAPFLSCFITGGIILFVFLAIFILREKQINTNT